MDGSVHVPDEDAHDTWDYAIRKCPIRDTLGRLGDKWSMSVLVALARNPKHTLRFSELLTNIGGISQRMLTTTLRALERDGILVRKQYPEVPPRVEYTLSERGNRFLTPIAALVSWIKSEVPQIEASRREHDLRYTKRS